LEPQFIRHIESAPAHSPRKRREDEANFRGVDVEFFGHRERQFDMSELVNFESAPGM
jgi:hypothetical protein